MRHLVIDQGNTSAKLAVYDASVQLWYHRTRELNSGVVNQTIVQYGVTAMAWCASGVLPFDIDEICGLDRVVEVTGYTQLPMAVDYITPETLGADRVAGVAGARAQSPSGDSVVISLGTCMTIDFVLGGQRWLGGIIAPGLDMRYRAMEAYTERLPYVHQRESTHQIGHSTYEALASGGYYGLANEVDGWIRYAEHIMSNPKVFCTGGDALELARVMKKKIFVRPFLILEGLNYLLTANA